MDQAMAFPLRLIRCAAVALPLGLASLSAWSQASAPGVDPGQGGWPGGAPAPGMPSQAPPIARLDARITQLESDLRLVTGRTEELSFELEKLQRRVERLAADLEAQINELRQSRAVAGGAPPGPGSGDSADDGPQVLTNEPAAASPAPPPQEPPATGREAPTPPPAALPGTPRELYAHGFSLMQKQDYVAAAGSFEEFLKKYPDDPLADNARYWLGESFYARGDFSTAAAKFLDAYEQNKASGKAPDALLKLGLSLGKLGKTKEACATFRELSRAQPNAPQSIKDKAAQESRRLGCNG
jgi:tol-pal system protein YbgF